MTRKRRYKRPWNRFPLALEEKVVALKEKNPSLTVSNACQILEKNRVKISRKGVWNVWQRYGFVAFIKDKIGEVTDCRKYQSISPEVKENVGQIKALLNNGKIEEAVNTLNLLPVCPEDSILTAVPKYNLSLRRQSDLLMLESGKISLKHYHKMATNLRAKLERKRMYYTSLRIGAEEGAALTYLEKPKELLKLTTQLRTRMQGLRDPWLRFTFSLLEGYGLASLLEIGAALKCVSECKIIIRNLPNAHFLMGELTSLYYKLGKYREAIFWAKKALGGVTGEYRKDLYSGLVGYLTVSGDYHYIPKILKDEELEKWGYHTRLLLCNALFCLNQGDFQKAASLAEEALLSSRKEGIGAFLFQAVFVLACCRAAVGEKRKAHILIRKYNPLIKKYHLEREYFLQQILMENSCLPKGIIEMPPIRLAHLFCRAKTTMRARDYRKAWRYAQTQKLLGLFERLALFFSEPVVQLLKKGKNPKLPRTFLRMPVFQIDPPVYHLQFLGSLRISKQEKLISGLKLGPKHRAFLIHLSMNRSRRILLDDLYHNFWPQSLKPSRNLSHLLVYIKKALGLPSHLLKIRGDYLVCNFYFTTDYGSFGETLAQAKALERAPEWNLARAEYLNAFKIFRGAPFRKMYDDWSETARQAILNKLEGEMLTFAQSCLAHKNKKEAKRALERVFKIIPYSQEIKVMVASLPKS